MSTDDKEKKGFSVDAGGDGSVVNITGGIREDHQYVTHEQNDSHDIHDSHNTTYVLNGNQSLKDLTLDERKRKYRDTCRKLMQNGMVSKEVRRKLDERALELDLDEAEKRELEQQVKSALQVQGAAGLSWSDKATLDLVIHLVNSNSSNLTDQLVNMEVLADKTEVDEVYIITIISCWPCTDRNSSSNAMNRARAIVTGSRSGPLWHIDVAETL